MLIPMIFLFILICIKVQQNCLNYVHALYLPMYRTNRGFPMHFHIAFPPFHLSNPLTMVYLYLSTLPGLAIHLSNACKLYSILTSALPFSVSILLFPYFFKIYGKFLSTQLIFHKSTFLKTRLFLARAGTGFLRNEYSGFLSVNYYLKLGFEL